MVGIHLVLQRVQMPSVTRIGSCANCRRTAVALGRWFWNAVAFDGSEVAPSLLRLKAEQPTQQVRCHAVVVA